VGWGVVSGFESGIRADRVIGEQRLAASTEAFGSSYSRFGRGQERGFGRTLLGGVAALLRLVIPVVLLLAIGATTVAYANQSAAVLGHPWMSLGLAALPVTFLAVHLTNRRYGPSYAFWQVILAWLVAGAVVVGGAENSLAPIPALTRDAIGFASGLFVAQMIAIFVFDRLRGPRWWKAPLFASLFGGLVLCLVAFPSAYFGTGVNWTSRMIDYFTWTSILSLILLVPYWMMRGLVVPKSGFGGY